MVATFARQKAGRTRKPVGTCRDRLPDAERRVPLATSRHRLFGLYAPIVPRSTSWARTRRRSLMLTANELESPTGSLFRQRDARY